MDKFITFIIFFLIGILIFILLKDYCNCNIVEGAGSDCLEKDEEKCISASDVCSWTGNKCVNIKVINDNQDIQLNVETLNLVNFFDDDINNNNRYGILRYIHNKSLSGYINTEFDTLFSIVDDQTTLQGTNFNNIVGNVIIDQDLLDFLTSSTEDSKLGRILQLLYYLIYVHKLEKNDCKLFPDIIVQEITCEEQNFVVRALSTSSNIILDGNEYNNCKKIIKNIILHPNMVNLVNKYYSQMRDDLESNKTINVNTFFIMYILIDTIYIIFNKYYNELSDQIISHLNDINNTYNTSSSELVENLQDDLERELFNNLFNTRNKNLATNLTEVALRPSIAIKNSTYIKDPRVNLSTNINESELVTVDSAVSEIKKIDDALNSIGDNIGIINNPPILDQEMEQQIALFNSSPSPIPINFEPVVIDQEAEQQMAMAARDPIRRPLHFLPVVIDGQPQPQPQPQTMSMHGCPVSLLYLNN